MSDTNDNFYCADWNRVGTKCEVQCQSCEKIDKPSDNYEQEIQDLSIKYIMGGAPFPNKQWVFEHGAMRFRDTIHARVVKEKDEKIKELDNLLRDGTYIVMEKTAEIERLKQGIRNALFILAEKRPNTPGLGGPIHILTEALTNKTDKE